MKRIMKSWATGLAHDGWLTETPSGDFEVWAKNRSTHPTKNRQYPPVLVETISAGEVARRDKAAEARQKEISVSERAEKKKKEVRQKWVNTLPETVIIGTESLTVNRQTFEISDSYGNFLFHLPVAPVDDFRAWLQKEINAFLEEGE
jgi:hypothetical protein